MNAATADLAPDPVIERLEEQIARYDRKSKSNIQRFKRIKMTEIVSAAMGPEWLNAKDESGARRLDHPGDFVRIETASALATRYPCHSGSSRATRQLFWPKVGFEEIIDRSP